MTEGSGLLQLGHRFYWPDLGRFIQQDPVGHGMNWYAYAGGNPISAIDPTGLVDLFAGLDLDAVGLPIGGRGVPGGWEGGFGYVYDTDHPSQSGAFATTGGAVGKNWGAAFVLGFALKDIEGFSYNADVNIGNWTAIFSWDDTGRFNGVAGGYGLGSGASFSGTYTVTDTNTNDYFISLWQDLKDIWWWLTNPCP